MKSTEEESKELLRSYLYSQWLRPENPVWDTIMALLLRENFQPEEKRLDFGSGNGSFTFIASGGRFADDYDWYWNADPQGFKENKDIYNYSQVSLSEFVERKPTVKWRAAFDHKANLLTQASQLHLYDEVIEGDGNQPSALGDLKFDLIYSNMLYWLQEPVRAINSIGQYMESGGRLVLSFPNPRFFEYASSYRWSESGSKLQRLLNRGRAESMIWSMDLENFEKLVGTDLRGFSLLSATTCLSKRLLSVWDIGLRPLSSALIKHVDRISKEERRLFKNEWCESITDIVNAQLEEEMSEDPSAGGYNFVVLEREGRS